MTDHNDSIPDLGSCWVNGTSSTQALWICCGPFAEHKTKNKTDRQTDRQPVAFQSLKPRTVGRAEVMGYWADAMKDYFGYWKNFQFCDETGRNNTGHLLWWDERANYKVDCNCGCKIGAETLSDMYTIQVDISKHVFSCGNANHFNIREAQLLTVTGKTS